MEIFMKLQNYKKMMMLCLVVMLLVTTASVIGVFFRGDMSSVEIESVRGEKYEMVTAGIYKYNSLRMVSEGVGWDIFTLFIALPIFLLVLPALGRGSLRGRLLAIGLLAYFFYQYFMYALAWAFGSLFLLFIFIFVFSLIGCLWIASGIDTDSLVRQTTESFPRRSMAVVSVLMSIVLILMWLQRIIAGLKGDLSTGMLLGQTTMVVQVLDLGLVVPLALFTALALWLKRPIGYLLSTIFVVKAVAMSAAICAMILLVWATEGKLEIVPLIIFGSATLATTYLGIQMYKGIGVEV